MGPLLLAASLAWTVQQNEAQSPVDAESCGAEAPRLEKALDDAMGKLPGCLDGINRRIARKIDQMVTRGKVRITCAQDVGTAGGITEFNQDGSAEIKMKVGGGGGLSHYPLAARVFHELVHATDPEGKLMISAQVHARPGFPDPVYGCQFACYGGVGMEEGDRIRNYQRHEGVVIDELDSYQCPPGEDEGSCSALKQYAYLCHLGKPVATEGKLEAEKKRQLPECILEKLINECGAKPCLKLRDSVVGAVEGNGGRMPSAVQTELKSLGKRLSDALVDNSDSALSPDDKKLYKPAKANKYYSKCMK